MSEWNDRTIFREIDEKGWREQQEYRRRIWRSRLELEKLIQSMPKPEPEPKP